MGLPLSIMLEVIKRHAGFLLLLVGLGLVGYLPSQQDFPLIVVGYCLAFLGLSAMLLTKPESNLQWKILIAGLILVFSFPNLSDDLYRFYWDGLLIQSGISPYAYLPTDVPDPSFINENKTIFAKLNSQNYFSVYPPVCQVLFYVAALLSKNLEFFSIVMKAIFLAFHCLAHYYWKKIKKAGSGLHSLADAAYFLNPLVLVEGIGNLHFEIVMVSFLIGFYHYYSINKWGKAAFMFAASVAIKLLPLMLLPYLIYQVKNQRLILQIIAWILLLFLPILLGFDILNLSKSVDLYFRKFEFNASIYYLLRWLGEQISGYNLILFLGPILGAITMIAIIRKSYQMAGTSLAHFARLTFFAFMVFLLLSTTVHPWYIITPLFFGMILGYRSLVMWSFLIVLSYAHYYLGINKERYGWIILEYASLLASYFYFEIYKRRVV